MRNPLFDSDVDGNTYSWMNDALRNEGISHQDQYICPICKIVVFEKDWSIPNKCCIDCFMDK